MTHHQLVVACPISRNEKNHKHLQNYFYINPFGRHNFRRPTTTANHQADPTCPLLVSREKLNCCTKIEKLEIREDDEDYEHRERDCYESC